MNLSPNNHLMHIFNWLTLSQLHSRWPLQPTNIGKHKNGYNLVIFTDKLKFDVGVAETHSQMILWARLLAIFIFFFWRFDQKQLYLCLFSSQDNLSLKLCIERWWANVGLCSFNPQNTAALIAEHFSVKFCVSYSSHRLDHPSLGFIASSWPPSPKQDRSQCEQPWKWASLSLSGWTVPFITSLHW